MTEKRKRPVLDEEGIKICRDALDTLIKLYNETNPEHGKQSEEDKNQKALIALQKIGRISGILTEWAENHIFGVYYNIAKSKEKWLDEESCNQHEHEEKWYNKDPEDLFGNEDQLVGTRAAIADILFNTFSKYGMMGWRMSLKNSLYALNEGQVDCLLEPVNTRQHGNAHEMQRLKRAVIKYVYKLIGEGWKKAAAQQRLAEYCGTTFESIKKWEREILKERIVDKEQLNLIELGAKFLSATQDIPYQEMLHMALYWNLYEEKEELQGISAGILALRILSEEYPIDQLKQRFIEAGMRISA